MKALITVLLFLPLSMWAQKEEFLIVFHNYCICPKEIKIWDESKELIMTLKVKNTDSTSIYLYGKKWYYYEILDLCPQKKAANYQANYQANMLGDEVGINIRVSDKKNNNNLKGFVMFLNAGTDIYLGGDLLIP